MIETFFVSTAFVAWLAFTAWALTRDNGLAVFHMPDRGNRTGD